MQQNHENSKGEILNFEIRTEIMICNINKLPNLKFMQEEQYINVTQQRDTEKNKHVSITMSNIFEYNTFSDGV